MDTRIHPASGIALLPQLSLWEVPPTQESVEQDFEHELRPISTFSSSTPIRFELKNPSNEYVNLSETYLSIKLKFKLTQSAAITAADWKKVKLAPNLLHSLFKHVGIEIAGKQLAPSPSLYAFRSYFSQLLGFSKTAKDGFLDSIGWKITDLDKLTNSGELNLDLLGVLNTDLNFQEKWIVGGTDLTIELIPNPVSFYAKCDSAQKIECEFTDCSLFVSRNRVSNALEGAHEKALRSAPCRYPFVRTDVRAMTLAPGTNDYILDNVATGFLPRRIFISFLKASDFYTDPYNFKPCGLNYLVAYQDGMQVPTKPFTPNFKDKTVTREFVAFYRALNQNNTDPILVFNKEAWSLSPIFGINFSPDQSPGVSAGSHVNHKRLGHLRLHVRFDEAVKDALIALIFMEFDSVLEIDGLRNIHVSY